MVGVADGERQRRLWVVVVLVVLATACGHKVYHRVRPGDTLSRISKAYGVGVQRIARANHVRDPARIEVGQRLLIPGATRELPVDVITPRDINATAPHHGEFPRSDGRRPFSWPIDAGTVSSGFGPRGKHFHDGIDIAAPIGTGVFAAADGEVIYADKLSGYGNVLIIRHADGYATVYAHNRENRAREGARVRRGQLIATVGESGHTTGPNLHFEVRQDNIARNPIYFLPQLTASAK